MIRRLTTRTVASAIAATAFGGALTFGSAVASATPQDDKFVEVVAALGIPTDTPEQGVQIGKDICMLLTQGGASGPNPVPAVRGTVNTLVSQGLEKNQAVPLLRAAVSTYCPEYGSIVGR